MCSPYICSTKAVQSCSSRNPLGLSSPCCDRINCIAPCMLASIRPAASLYCKNNLCSLGVSTYRLGGSYTGPSGVGATCPLTSSTLASILVLLYAGINIGGRGTGGTIIAAGVGFGEPANRSHMALTALMMVWSSIWLESAPKSLIPGCMMMYEYMALI